MGLPIAVAAALADGDGPDLRACGCGIARHAPASACQPRAAFDVDHRRVPLAHGHVVHDLFRRRPVRAFSAGAGDGRTGRAAVRKPQGGRGGDPADAGGPRGGLGHRDRLGGGLGGGRRPAARRRAVAGAEIGHGRRRHGHQRSPACRSVADRGLGDSHGHHGRDHRDAPDEPGRDHRFPGARLRGRDRRPWHRHRARLPGRRDRRRILRHRHEPQRARDVSPGAAGGDASGPLMLVAVQSCAAVMCCRHGDLADFLLGSPRATESPILINSATQGVLGLASGALVGFSLGLVGGGGSILAVPLMVYVVGVPDAHVAIGTGAFAGSIFGKMLDGERLLALFALLMLVIAVLMLKTRSRIGLPDVQMSWANTPAIVGLGLATGTLSGFFGIGGGFLIVPALMLATGMPIMNAVSSSLVAVTAFGLTTAASYAYSGLISWGLAGLFIAGGVAGGLIGTRSARLLSARRGALNIVFAAVIIAVALYMLARNISLS